jgi:MFS family permease
MTTPSTDRPPSSDPPASPSPVLTRLLGPAADSPGSRSLLVVALVDSSGTGLYLAGSAVFFSLVIGLSATQVGLGLSLAGLLGLVAAPSLGWCADRWGPQRVLVLLHVWRALAFTLLAFAGNFAGFVIATAMIGVGQQALSPVYQALVEHVAGSAGRVAVMARTRVVYNVGFSLGGVVATVVIGLGGRATYRSMILAIAVCCLLAAGLLSRLAVAPRPAEPESGRSRSPLHLRSLRDGRYLGVGILNGTLGMHTALLTVGIPLWITMHTDAPKALVGMLLVINTVLAVLLQVPFSRGTDTIAGGTVALRRGGLALAGCCVLLSVTPAIHQSAAVVVVLVLGVFALTAAELLQSAGGWGLSYALAPSEGRAEALSTFNLGSSAQFILGPTIVTLGVVERGAIGWLVLGACFVVITAVVGPAVRAAERWPALVREPA